MVLNSISQFLNLFTKSSNVFGYLLLAIMRVFTSHMVTEAQYCKCWLLSQWLNTGDQWTASDLQMCLFSLLTSPPSPSLFIASHSCLGHIPLSLQYLITLCSALWMGWNISSVQFSHSVVSDSSRPHEPQHTRPPCPSPTPGVYPNSCPLSWWCHPTISSVSPSPPAFNFPNICVFSNESALCIRWPKYWSFTFNISPSNEHPGLISFTLDWLDLLAVQGTLKSLLQHHGSKASILQCSAL